MTNLEKIEWVHSQLEEIHMGNSVDLETIVSFIEDIREELINKET